MIDLDTPLLMLVQLDWAAWLTMFWFMIVLEVPRYTLSAVAIFISSFTRKHAPTASETRYLDSLKISVVIAGHNEADAIERCLRSLGEQTRRIDEIIFIDDGSTDGMREIINKYRQLGQIDIALSNQVRCGKPASCNLGFSLAKGDIIVNLDADCSYDCDAIAKLIEPFTDPRVGATTGALGVRNYDYSAVTGYQAIEYIVSIGMGKRALDMLDMVVCASGAFGAFRREALHQVGHLAAGPGEDFDLTLRLRRSGWKIRFAADSWCFTDTPATFAAIIRQRRRWDRDTLRIRMRKFRDTFSPGRRKFILLETFEQCEWMVMNVLVTVVFPAYVLWVFWYFGEGALNILIAVAIVYLVLDAIGFLMALCICRRYNSGMVWTIAPYILTFGIYNGIFMRCVRLYAYCEEWIYRASARDSYSPSRVSRQAYYRR
ncbi:glycosyltransferase [Bosea sp. (in: a-proteobacteria)]|uniref:glycosyltransferase n=1 Tax=Bosea sp. (in: a-proteobacteria) TaxID=1871050 RepID=UPI002FC5AD34